MTFADIEATWRSPHNRPSAAEITRLKATLTADLRARHRGFAFWMFIVLGALAWFTGRLIWFAWFGSTTKVRFDLRQEWGALVFLAVTWGAAILVVRRYLQHRARHTSHAWTIVDSVRAALDENRTAQARLRLIEILMGAMALMMPLAVYQLRAVGKAGDEVLLPAFVLVPAFVVMELLALRYYRRRKLYPRQLQLERILREYEAVIEVGNVSG